MYIYIYISDYVNIYIVTYMSRHIIYKWACDIESIQILIRYKYTIWKMWYKNIWYEVETCDINITKIIYIYIYIWYIELKYKMDINI